MRVGGASAETNEFSLLGVSRRNGVMDVTAVFGPNRKSLSPLVLHGHLRS